MNPRDCQYIGMNGILNICKHPESKSEHCQESTCSVIPHSKVLVYHHSDADGYCSAAIIKQHYEKMGLRVKCVSVDYPGNWNIYNIKDANLVFVVDFSFADMPELAKTASTLIWIDHHITAINKFPVLSNLPGIRSIHKSACELTWEFINPTIPTPDIVKLIGDKDLWKFEYFDTLPFCETVNTYLVGNINHKDWNRLLNNDLKTHKRYLELGLILEDAKHKRIEDAFDTGVEKRFHDHRTLVVNSTTDTSELGDYITNLYGYDIALIWKASKQNYIVSLRSNKVNVRIIAEQYGGGGHDSASGFVVRDLRLLKGIID